MPTNYILSFNAKVTELRFFEIGYNLLPYNKRKYNKIFSAATTRYIAWELNLRFEKLSSRKDLEIKSKYYRSDGSIMAQQIHNSFIKPDSTWSWHISSWGSKGPGSWKVGDYRLDLYIEDNMVASDTFSVY